MEVPFKQVGKTKEQGKEGGEREARQRKKLGNSKKERKQFTAASSRRILSQKRPKRDAELLLILAL